MGRSHDCLMLHTIPLSINGTNAELPYGFWMNVIDSAKSDFTTELLSIPSVTTNPQL